MLISTLNRALKRILIVVHWFLTRTLGLVLLGLLIWYLPAIFNTVSGVFENLVEFILRSTDMPSVIRFAVTESKPEQILLFIVLLIPLYFLVSYLLWPIRHGITSKTAKMVGIQIFAFIGLYSLAWFAPDIFTWIFDKSLYVRELLFSLIGTSETGEFSKAVIRAAEPRSIFAFIFMTLFLYFVLFLLRMMFRLFRR